MGPDFFIIGAPKAGTTWLYRNLSLNRRIFLPDNKEPRFYCVEEGEELNFRGPGDDGWLSHFVRQRSAYEALFAAAGPDQLRGEASSDYLYRAPVAAPRIRAERPDARIIALLRDPAERAHSNWLHHRRDGRERLDFGAAMAAEEERIEAGWAWWWHYGRRGYYAEQLQPFFEHFPSEQILLLTYDEIGADPAAVLARASAFLGVEAVVDAEVGVSRNPSLVPRSGLHRAARRVLRPNPVSRALLPRRLRSDLRHRLNRATMHRPSFDPDDRRRLRRAYRPDVKRLAGMADLDLTRWVD